MTDYPGKTAVAEQGWLKAHRFLLLRRFNQFGVLFMFLLGPLFGAWLVTGTLSSSMTLDILPLTDPLLLTQSMLSGTWPAMTGLIGALLVLVFYAVLGGRVFCSWVCPVNLITDLAAWLRRRFDIRSGARLSRNLRWWLLGLVLAFPPLTGVMVWEYVNPVSMLHRGLIFGFGWAWLILLAVFLYDLFLVRRGWCGHLCPVGACYALIGAKSPVHVAATGRERCDDCMDCFDICPEPQVIKPALKGAAAGLGPRIASLDCTRCGRCIDVCSKDVFQLKIKS
ncbi:quinol dehydrogenase ferredoxin subunit NapH [Thiohalocapsa marina]|uniref:Quinol dehydrogenase ferredoxin subunit NapH n=1 Tax=Thiohalocapsa marina TaxID=424902 RepID=A0A5M8FSX5_9GAMM|nr:quinol dehydrogenase ferredoxin subunit NapH [Thiohalocapsa marina]KAA6186302.1 quinol dehydrogenase ferredoxin subunit NapH [Thiohalocapsa marina]